MAKKPEDEILPLPHHASEKTSSTSFGRSGEDVIGRVLSGLVNQSELDDLLDLLYGSYGKRLIVSYKEAS